jgi:predicted KAP-like P-loop ATPase
LTVPTPEFSNDRPLDNKADDKLSRAPFADRIAGVILNLPKSKSITVGIYGPWGDGKTTVLNLLRTDLSISDSIVVRNFNPWRLTDDEAMLRGFFSVISEAIGASLSTKLERAKAGAGKWAKRARWITKPAGWFWKPAETADDLLSKFADIAASGDSVGLEELRSRIFALLQQSQKRIVVLVDDIDRLDKHETHTLFRLIKACADFPNVCYVLAFDDAAVAKTLREQYGGDESSGRAFLEKIVQVPLKLPVAAKEDLRELCFEQVDKAVRAAEIELTQNQVGEFITGFDRGVSVRLNTPRAAKRYGNGLMFALPMLKGETNPADLLLAEALRAFFPEVYEIVRDNHSEFSGVEREVLGRIVQGSRSVQLLKPLFDKMETQHAEAVKALLIDLFPRLSGLYGRSTFAGNEWLLRWSEEQRISSPQYCPRYFTYTVPRKDVPDSEILSLLESATRQDEQCVEAWLINHLNGSQARRVIEKLRASETTLDPAAAETLATAMAKLGGNIPNLPAVFSFAEAPSQAAIFISHLLRRIADRSKRLAMAKQIVKAADPLWFGGECVRWLYITDKPEKQDDNTLTKEQIQDVRMALVDRIKSASAAGTPLFDPDVRQERSLLFEWWRAEGRDPVQAHLLAVFEKNPKQVGRFLQSQAPLAQTIGSALPHTGELEADQLKTIKLIISLDTLAEWIRRQCPGDFNNPQWFPDHTRPIEQRLAEEFMFVYNKWKKEGEPPDAKIAEDSTHDGSDDEGDNKEQTE